MLEFERKKTNFFFTSNWNINFNKEDEFHLFLKAN